MAEKFDDRAREDRERELALAQRSRAEQAKQIRSERLRQDAVGIAAHILDTRITTPDAIQPALIGFSMAAAMGGDALSSYEQGPIRDALLIRAMSGDIEKAQYGLVAERDKRIEEMMTNPLLQSALYKYDSYDPDIGDRPVEMSGDEWEVFGQYLIVKNERQAIVDRMTDGVASLYDDREELQARVSKLGSRLENLEARAGTLSSEERENYETLLAKMFGELKGPEANMYSRWAGMDISELTSEERVMLTDVWNKMMTALDGGEEAELEGLRERGVRDLTAAEQKLYDRRLSQLREKITDEAELTEFDRLMAVPSYKINSKDRASLDATVEMAAEDASVGKAEIGLFWKLKERKEGVARMAELVSKETSKTLSRGERGVFEDLRARAGTLTEAEMKSIEVIGELIENLKGKMVEVNKNIDKKASTLGRSSEWMRMAKAFNGICSNINVTEQWMRAWNDLDAAAELFTQTKWVEFQKPSDMVALLELPGVGDAFRVAFSAMCKIGLNRIGEVPGSANIMQMKDKTEKTVQEKFIEPVRKYVVAELNGKVPDLYVNFGVEMARMLMENSFVAGRLCVPRDEKGNILYSQNGNRISSDPRSEDYVYGVPFVFGVGSVRADWDPDYKKIAALRAKLLEDYAKRFETGLPAMLPVLPDDLAQAWLTHKEILAVANESYKPGERGVLASIFEAKEENSRLAFMHKIYRSAQVYAMVSKFVVGLKGFRSAGEEVLYFLQSPSNLGGLSKKIDLALGADDPTSGNYENIRFRTNFALALLYAVYERNANPNKSGEKKTVLSKRGEGSIQDTLVKAVLGELRDDIGDMFVNRTDFVPQAVWDLIWNTRFKPINPGEGGKFGVGMIKKGEAVDVFSDIAVDPKITMDKRRNDLLHNV